VRLVSVTGGTGFVGAATVAEIVRSGHRVRLLARDPDRVPAALSPLGVDLAAVDVVRGDVTDETAVAVLVRGADAVLHAASVYSFDSRAAEVMRATNARGTELVLAAARAVDGPVVHVSSVGALFRHRPQPEDLLGPWSPVGDPRETYLASKADAERVARSHQDQGAPVVITYPPALLGPDDPYTGDQNARLRDVLRGLMPMWPSGNLPIGDVRDTAAVHAAVLTASAPGTGGNRVFGPGTLLTTRQYLAVVRAVTDRALPTLFLPARAMFPVGRFTGLAQRVWPWHIPAEFGALYVCATAVGTHPDAPTAGVAARPVEHTVRDTVRWLHRTGQLTDRQAGAVARSGAADPATDGVTVPHTTEPLAIGKVIP